MPNDASEVFVAANGHIYVGATSATAPTDATSNPGAGWSDLGYCTEDGVSLAPGQTVTDVMVWQEFYPLKRIPTAKSFEVSFTLAQLNSETLTLALGGGVASGTAGTYEFAPASAQTLDERSMVIDVIDNTRIYRFYIPTGIVINLGQVTFNRQSIVNLPVTFGATATGTSDPFSVFIEDDEFPVGSGELAS
jgi:hypothetical protein